MTHVIVNDASCLIDLHKARLLHALRELPHRLVVPLPIRASEVLTLSAADWALMDARGLTTFDLPGEDVVQAMGYRMRNPGLSANDSLCLATAQRFEDAVLLTGDRLLRNVAKRLEIDVHGVLWLHDLLVAADAAPVLQLRAALEIWRDDAAVFLPRAELERRLRRLR